MSVKLQTTNKLFITMLIKTGPEIEVQHQDFKSSA